MFLGISASGMWDAWVTRTLDCLQASSSSKASGGGGMTIDLTEEEEMTPVKPHRSSQVWGFFVPYSVV
jgi:hypothetical protein